MTCKAIARRMLWITMALMPALGMCEEKKLIKNWRTSDQAAVDYAKALAEVNGKFKVVDVRGIDKKFNKAVILETEGIPVIALKPDDGDAWLFTGHNCDGRYRSNGSLVMMVCDTHNEKPTDPGSFFTIQKLAQKRKEEKEGGKSKVVPDTSDKGSFIFALYDQTSGRQAYFVLERE